MSEPATRLVCTGCGASPAEDDPYPFRCPRSGVGDVDHVLARQLDTAVVSFPPPGEDPEPFVAGRHLLHSYHRARAGGIGDERFVELVRRLDARIGTVDGHGFTRTPLTRSEALSRALGFSPRGGVLVKDETRNVSGSHKARHLMGVALHLEVSELLGLSDPSRRAGLAIASCGNAALAAAVVAAAGSWRLNVFVPPGADPVVLKRLVDLDAEIVTCERRPGEAGDPTYLRLLDALERGLVPFTCQGNLNGLAIEGGETLGYELVAQLRNAATVPDHVVVQVGGGALASACAQSLTEAVALGVLGRLPRLHTVQTAGAHPLERAYHRMLAALGELAPSTGGPASQTAGPAIDAAPAPEVDPARLDAALAEAARHRSAYMWPWEHEPHSIAHGILDDETYDWLGVVRGMLHSGGRPVVVSEERLAAANELGSIAGYDADPTGTSGLAGLMDLVAHGTVGPDDTAVVLFTGVRR
jgi:threonine synthase